MKTQRAFSLPIRVFCSFLIICFSHALDTLGPGDSLYSNETLVSAGGVFELGFFSFSESSNTYLGIWNKNDRNKRPVWVANREEPLVDSSGFLKIRYDGNLVLSDRRATTIFVNSGALAGSNETSSRILDSGNLILIQGEKTIWQSFDDPTDTFLPGMKLGRFNMGTDQLRIQYLNSWLSPFLPGAGQYSLGIDETNLTRFNVWRGDHAYQEIGFWDGHTFRLFFESLSNDYSFVYQANASDAYLTFNNKDSNELSWFVMAYDGVINEFRMVGKEISIVNHSLCDNTLARNSTGCLVMMPSMCKNGDNFSDIQGVLPSSAVVIRPAPMGLSDCEIICKSNCSCAAYAFSDDNGCELYYGTKNDLLNLIERGNDTIYVRHDASMSGDQKKKKPLLIVIAAVVPLILLILIFLSCLWRKCSCLGVNENQAGTKNILPLILSQFSTSNDSYSSDVIELGSKKDHQLPLLSFSSLVAATDNFSAANKLGEGGFGPVYKGKLQGLDIAVKRLSQTSGQGLQEFKNEVELISKLQHRNLVKLLGYCIQQEEKILIYEYMPNNSLDSFIFDQVKRPQLDWRKRREIIEGTAQGLLYLHKYSRLRIIHRDLKTSNILLDDNMNPKISDFGMARIFFENESQAKTKKLAGTYGYMSPEYAVHGVFSTKSDIFSFGVILLEIVSGRKNSTFEEPNSSLNLLGYAWELWNGDRCVELMDPTITCNSCSVGDVVLCIHIGLLCVQESADDRPDMSDVVSMLSSEGANLPTPKQPAFSTLLSVADNSSSRRRTPSRTFGTISSVEPR
ncbi:Serine/threonine protein kinase [Trema orientale]|uniref:Receptor-like serine/threonine-protein kinase n=1 Tax=Trema orientale TaxID=63057 RepID=A0A2P5CM83_TREOI|nr:Serine/threonine protein kinase [Trema orientale]